MQAPIFNVGRWADGSTDQAGGGAQHRKGGREVGLPDWVDALSQSTKREVSCETRRRRRRRWRACVAWLAFLPQPTLLSPPPPSPDRLATSHTAQDSPGRHSVQDLDGHDASGELEGPSHQEPAYLMFAWPARSSTSTHAHHNSSSETEPGMESNLRRRRRYTPFWAKSRYRVKCQVHPSSGCGAAKVDDAVHATMPTCNFASSYHHHLLLLYLHSASSTFKDHEDDTAHHHHIPSNSPSSPSQRIAAPSGHLKPPISTSMQSMRANWRPEPERGVTTLCSGGSGRFYRHHDNGDDDGGTASGRMAKMQVTRVKGVIFTVCTMPFRTPHGITHPSTPFPAIMAIRLDYQECTGPMPFRMTRLGITGMSRSRGLWGVLSCGHPLIPTLSFDEDIPMHGIPYPYDISNLLSVSPDEVASVSYQFIPPTAPPTHPRRSWPLWPSWTTAKSPRNVFIPKRRVWAPLDWSHLAAHLSYSDHLMSCSRLIIDGCCTFCMIHSSGHSLTPTLSLAAATPSQPIPHQFDITTIRSKSPDVVAHVLVQTEYHLFSNYFTQCARNIRVFSHGRRLGLVHTRSTSRLVKQEESTTNLARQHQDNASQSQDSQDQQTRRPVAGG
ncbi:hypothetical protein BD410DRAFT_832431 [Rickenella mellea]|uniref:Uncharacterized protein n=1 Tax=Rickenella mellea TaxID=50990 RepID=A0A4Y7PJV9_9AGAM|nr:hypothetical protein BD410DRAFT_832431 [Rickenella mellea]